MIKLGDKLYIVTRRDLSPGYQAAQSCHALRQFVNDWPQIDNEWFNVSNYLVLLSVQDEQTLKNLADEAAGFNIKISSFYEPDLDDQLTAIALEPGNKTSEFCKQLPLALNEI